MTFSHYEDRQELWLTLLYFKDRKSWLWLCLITGIHKSFYSGFVPLGRLIRYALTIVDPVHTGCHALPSDVTKAPTVVTRQPAAVQESRLPWVSVRSERELKNKELGLTANHPTVKIRRLTVSTRKRQETLSSSRLVLFLFSAVMFYYGFYFVQKKGNCLCDLIGESWRRHISIAGP